MEMTTDKQESKKNTEDLLAKIAITKEADRFLGELVSRVNEGFDAGKAIKQDIASYIICEFGKAAGEGEIQGFRAMFFNPILLMEATLKRAKETGVLPDHLRDALMQQFQAHNAGTPNLRKTKKNLKSDIIKDNVVKDEEAA